MEIRRISDIDIDGKKVFIRCDFNVPLSKEKPGVITDDTRIRASLPTIKYALEHNCPVILASHLGRPKGTVKKELSLAPVADALREMLPGVQVRFVSDCIGPEVIESAQKLKEGEILLLENLRFHPGEEANDPAFAKQLADLADVFIQDAFGTVHRAHASTAGTTNYLPSAAGLLVTKEVEVMGSILENPARPFLAVLGGAKVSSKIAIIDNLMDKVDSLIIGGAMAYTFLSAQGTKTGNSLVEQEYRNAAKRALEHAKDTGKRLLLPIDHVIAASLEPDANVRTTGGVEIPDGWLGVDIGPMTLSRLAPVIAQARTVLWNGPMGIFEDNRFANGTFEVAKMLAAATGRDATTVVGGGDSVSAIKKAGLTDEFSHISTGGGASLEFLEGKELPGLVPLKKE